MIIHDGVGLEEVSQRLGELQQLNYVQGELGFSLRKTLKKLAPHNLLKKLDPVQMLLKKKKGGGGGGGDDGSAAEADAAPAPVAQTPYPAAMPYTDPSQIVPGAPGAPGAASAPMATESAATDEEEAPAPASAPVQKRLPSAPVVPQPIAAPTVAPTMVQGGIPIWIWIGSAVLLTGGAFYYLRRKGIIGK